MKMIFSLLISLFITETTFASEYFLEINKTCTTTGDKLNFKCDKSKNEKSLIFNKHGKWYGRNTASDDVWGLDIIKDDPFILILDNPVFFSGKSIIYIMKPTKRFYWSEFAYSEILEIQEATIRYGHFLKVK